MSQKTVSSDLVEKEVMTQKTTKERRKPIVYEISQYTKPETAAEKIHATFGDEFALAIY